MSVNSTEVKLLNQRCVILKIKGKRMYFFLIIVTEDFSHYMRRHMTKQSWVNLFTSIKTLIKFVKEHSDWNKLVDFNLECLIRDDQEWFDEEYDKMILKPHDYYQERIAFQAYMERKMTNDHWRILIHWILEWETSLIFIDPQPPLPWPSKPLFDTVDLPVYVPSDEDKWNLEDMILALIENTELKLPTPAKAENKCKS